MTYEELSIGGKAICIALALSPFWMGWLGEQFGKWARRKYEQSKSNRHETSINRKRAATQRNA